MTIVTVSLVRMGQIVLMNSLSLRATAWMASLEICVSLVSILYLLMNIISIHATPYSTLLEMCVKTVSISSDEHYNHTCNSADGFIGDGCGNGEYSGHMM